MITAYKVWSCLFFVFIYGLSLNLILKNFGDFKNRPIYNYIITIFLIIYTCIAIYLFSLWIKKIEIL
jgi:hypothetical protein